MVTILQTRWNNTIIHSELNPKVTKHGEDLRGIEWWSWETIRGRKKKNLQLFYYTTYVIKSLNNLVPKQQSANSAKYLNKKREEMNQWLTLP